MRTKSIEIVLLSNILSANGIAEWKYVKADSGLKKKRYSKNGRHKMTLFFLRFFYQQYQRKLPLVFIEFEGKIRLVRVIIRNIFKINLLIYIFGTLTSFNFQKHEVNSPFFFFNGFSVWDARHANFPINNH